MKVLLLDRNHPLITEQLTDRGFTLDEAYDLPYEEVCKIIGEYEGIIIRSRIPVNKNLLEHATQLKFIARVGAGMENIDVAYAKERNIALINSPEGNRDAVAEQVVGMLLILMNRLFIAAQEVKNGIWKREENRGDELCGKTVGLIGYGNMGKATARRLSGFGCKVIFYDILPDLGDAFATQVSLQELQQCAEIISLHIPITPETHHLIDENFIAGMAHPFYLVNTARGKNVKSSALVSAIKEGKVKGAALDVLEFEKASFENVEVKNSDLEFMLQSDKCLITPHIAGWTVQSKIKLAQFIVDKILQSFTQSKP